MKEQNNLEFKILMKNIKKNNNIIEKRNKTRQEFRKRKEEREKKFEEVYKRKELHEKNKKNEIYKRQMTHDLKNIQKRYQILKPEYDDEDLYYNNKDIKNKKIGNQINVYSNKRRQHLNDIKNIFYKKNQKLKIEYNNNNFMENLNNIDKEINNLEKSKNAKNKEIKINKFTIEQKPKIINNTNTFNKTKKNMIKNKNIIENQNNIINYLEIKRKKYDFKVIDNKLNEKLVNNICFDGELFDNFPNINQK